MSDNKTHMYGYTSKLKNFIHVTMMVAYCKLKSWESQLVSINPNPDLRVSIRLSVLSLQTASSS